MQARLKVEKGKGTPTVCELDVERPTTLGRHRTNSLVLQDRHASRWHAEVFRQNGHWLLRDCATLNGTKLNGERIEEPAVLGDGDRIAIGDTQLSFTMQPFDGSATEMTPAITPEEDALPSSSSDLVRTPLHQDELTVLCTFMAGAVEETCPRSLVRRALEVIQSQTKATLAGFLSLDPEEPLPKQVLPDLARVDVQLSRQLTQLVQRDGKTVWLGGGAGDAQQSDSLLPFRDALCVPLRADAAAMGALHVYKSGHHFGEREVRFCEVLAGYLAGSLHVLRARRTLEAENSRLREHAAAAADDILIGESPAMQRVRQNIRKLAPLPGLVLVVGESGTGKELVSLSLHRQSQRRDGPLVVVNCAAIASGIPEAELFGHCKGAFTGAISDRQGFFQQADEGTLFLDELGELSLDCQAKLLRVIEGKGFRPVGAAREVHTDVRVVAATNRDLQREVEEGRFRRDLYFRLGIPIEVPPLRKHAEDIPALVDHFLRKLAVSYHRSMKVTKMALRRLQEYTWPGNVRQLAAVLEHAIAMCPGNIIDADDLQLPEEDSASGAEGPPALDLQKLEEWAVRQALARTKGNVTRASRLLGINRDTVQEKIKKYGINKKGDLSAPA